MICDSCDCDFMECQVKAECMLKCFAKSTGATVLVSLYFSYIRSCGISNNLSLTFFRFKPFVVWKNVRNFTP